MEHCWATGQRVSVDWYSYHFSVVLLSVHPTVRPLWVFVCVGLCPWPRVSSSNYCCSSSLNRTDGRVKWALLGNRESRCQWDWDWQYLAERNSTEESFASLTQGSSTNSSLTRCKPLFEGETRLLLSTDSLRWGYNLKANGRISWPSRDTDTSLVVSRTTDLPRGLNWFSLCLETRFILECLSSTDQKNNNNACSYLNGEQT